MSLHERRNTQSRNYSQNKMATMVADVLDDVLCSTLHHMQRTVRSIFYNVADQVIWELVCWGVIGQTINALVAMFFDKNEAAEGLSEKLLTLTSFVPLIATVSGRKRTHQL